MDSRLRRNDSNCEELAIEPIVYDIYQLKLYSYEKNITNYNTITAFCVCGFL
jgi:hypothetical protein